MCEAILAYLGGPASASIGTALRSVETRPSAVWERDALLTSQRHLDCYGYCQRARTMYQWVGTYVGIGDVGWLVDVSVVCGVS